MKLTSCLLFAHFVLLSGLCIADSPEEKASEWLDSRKPSGLVLVHVFEEESFVGRQVTGTNRVSYALRAKNWAITLGFQAPIDDASTLQDVRDSFSFIALDTLPTPGLEIDNWEIKPRTPTSSFSDGVEILDYREGQVTLRVKTKFFALYGRDTTVLVPADAGLPEGSYFSIREPLDLDMTIVATVKHPGV